MKTILKKMNYILTGKQKAGSVLVGIVLMIGSIFELLGVAMLLPFIQAMLSPEVLRENEIVQFICGIFKIDDNMNIVMVVGVALIFIYIVKNLFLTWVTHYESVYATKMRNELSLRIFNDYLNKEYSFFLNRNSSTLLRGVSSDVSGVYLILKQLLRIVAECLTIALIGIYLFMSNALIAVVLVGLVVLCVVWFVFNFRKQIKEAGIVNNETLAEISKYGLQTFMGVKDILVMQRKKFFAKHFEGAVAKNAEAARRMNVLESLPTRIFETVCISGIIGIVCILNLLGNNMTTMVPTMAVFAAAAFRIMPCASRLSASVNAIMFNRPALDNIYYVLKNDVKPNQNIEEGVDKPVEKKILQSSIDIKGITWSYGLEDSAVIKNLNLTIRKGTSVALIGNSGAGKTTLADILLGLLKPQKGHVYVDDMDIFEHPYEWAKMVGYVPQAVYMTDDTIRNNVAFGIEESEIDEDMIWHALEQAQLDKFVKGLPQQLDTIVGERGVRFSGGQRQRIAIARALYHNPDILVLDEATSALDNDTESAVMEAIDSLQGIKTLIIVAHRLSTIANCDEIYEIADGKALKRNKEEVLG